MPTKQQSVIPYSPTLSPIPRSWWVSREKGLLAGEFPGSSDPVVEMNKIQNLLHSGIRVFINLQEEDELDSNGIPFTNYRRTAEYLAEKMDISLSFIRFPVVRMEVPSELTLYMILDQINVALLRKYPVYLHCAEGHGRTGTAIGCWLVQQGFDFHQVLKYIILLRSKDPFLKKNRSPQTKEQIDVIKDFSLKQSN